MGDKASYVGIAGPGPVGLVFNFFFRSQVLKVKYDFFKKLKKLILKKLYAQK